MRILTPATSRRILPGRSGLVLPGGIVIDRPGIPIDTFMAELFPSASWGEPDADATWVMPGGAIGEGFAPLVFADPGGTVTVTGPHIPPQAGGGNATLLITSTVRAVPGGCAASAWNFEVGITSPFNPGGFTQVNRVALGSGEPDSCAGNISATPAGLVSGLTWDFNASGIDVASPGTWRRSHTQFIFPRDSTQEYDFHLRFTFGNGPLPTGAVFVTIELDGAIVV